MIDDGLLIARLRSGLDNADKGADGFRELGGVVMTMYNAADRVEALIAERDDLQAWKRYWSGEYDTVLAGRAYEYDRAEAAEAKLAKAMKALEFYAYGHAVPPSWQHAHNTLAEIKGEN